MSENPEEPIRQRYTDVQKKHGLPEYEHISLFFDLALGDKTLPLLQEICSKIHQKAELYSQQLESTLQPETTLAELYESKGFTDTERTELYALYKRIMYLLRASLETATQNTDEARAHFITEACSLWQEINPALLTYTAKLKELWTHESATEEELGYLG